VARGSTSYHKWEGNKTYTSLLGAEVANILPHQLCLFPTLLGYSFDRKPIDNAVV